MTHKVGAKGQVVIPKAIRDRLGIEPGDEVAFESEGKDIRIRHAEDDPAARVAKIKTLRGAWSESAGGGTEELMEERRRERELEELKARRRGVGRPR